MAETEPKQHRAFSSAKRWAILVVFAVLAFPLAIIILGLLGLLHTNFKRSSDTSAPIPIYAGAETELDRFPKFVQTKYPVGSPIRELRRDLIASGFKCTELEHHTLPGLRLSYEKRRMPMVAIDQRWRVTADTGPDRSTIADVTAVTGLTGL